MKVCITGATGFIGKRLTEKLLEQGITVHALYRDEARLLDLRHPNLVGFKGDIRDRKSIDTAMQDCRFVFHLAAYARVWSQDKNRFRDSIFQGTVNVLEAAIQHKVEKVIITSTAGVFGPSSAQELVDESRVRTIPYFSKYEKYKDMSDRYCMDHFTRHINFCMVCPSRVFGPGELSDSNAVTRLIKLYQAGKFHFLPGDGKSVGNYVYIDDVVNGIIQALRLGKRGERYILGGENISYSDFFSLIDEISGKKHHLFRMPLALMLSVAWIMQAGAVLFRIPPLITPGWVKRYLHNWYLSHEKAITELGYKPLPLKPAIRKTLVWILAQEENKTGTKSVYTDIKKEGRNNG